MGMDSSYQGVTSCMGLANWVGTLLGWGTI